MTGADFVYGALLDVLGYKHHLNQDKASGEFTFKDSLQKAMSCFGDINEANYFYQAISDTVIITSPRRDELVEFLRLLKKIQISFLKEKLLIRGGVTYSHHFKSGNVTYSHAIARAYELESSMAIYPRIVIDKNIIDMFKSANDMVKITKSKLVANQNGIYFLNILDSKNFSSVFEMAKTIYLQQKDVLKEREPEFLKHVWFENYLLAYASSEGIKKSPYISKIDFTLK